MTMGCSARIKQLVRMGKGKAAEYIKTCQSPEIVNGILDRILNHEVSIDDSDSIDWIRWLMAGGNTPENFTAIVKKYHHASICGLVWTAQSVAYRCKTCSLSPCMSLCADCFVNGQHDGHDYQMFRSTTGGACDCGDTSVMQCEGFCSRHGTSGGDSKNLLPPPDLLYIAELMAPRIFFRLILHLRNHHYQAAVSNDEIHLGADNFLALLCELSDMGAAMMRVLTSALTNADVYRKLTQEWTRDGSAYADYMITSENLYKKALGIMKNPEPLTEFKNCPALQVDLVHKTFLQELVFWMIKYEFPLKLINFLLVMLPDAKYKEALIEAYILHYSRILMVIARAADPDSSAKRISQINVQWFSNRELAVKMAEKFSLLQVMMVSLKNMVHRILIPVESSSSASESKHFVVNCDSPVVSQCRHWLFVSDLNNVISYESVALKFMNDESLVRTLFSFLSYFQGMNVNRRRRDEHVEHERNPDPVFVAELWTTSLISPLLSHLKDEATVFLTKSVLSHCLEALETWLQLAGTIGLEEDQVSFHIPLHRLFANLICHAINVQHVELTDVMPPDNLIRWILRHPLHIQAIFYDIINGLWVRNGIEIRKQAFTYTQSDFCSSMIDADLFLLQIIGTKLPPNEIMKATMTEFRTNKWFQLGNHVDENAVTEIESKEDATVEGFLMFWATLCVTRTNLGNSPAQNIRNELVTMLCVADRTHSQLVDYMPEKIGTGNPSQFDAILDAIADYKPPNFKYDGNMQQGSYTPKACVWTEFYDPIHLHLRTGINRRDAQNATNRFTEYFRKNKQLSSADVLWKPYRIPAVCERYPDPRHMLNGRIFHTLVWLVLYKYVHQGNVSENVLALTVYLFELAASVVAKEVGDGDQKLAEPVDVTDQNLEHWFASDLLVENIRTEIRKVNCTSISTGQTHAIEVNESIISLLLKCYLKLGGRDTVFSIDNNDVSVLENRIGDGAAFVEKTLIRIVLLSDVCRKTMMNCHEKLHSKLKAESTRKEYAEKKRKAEERRRRIMDSLAKQRDKFAKENKSMLEEDKMDWQPSETSESGPNPDQNEKHYCGICRKILPSTRENPVVLLTQIQSTNVLGHRKSSAGVSFAQQQREEVTLLSEEFSDWSDSVTFGWEDGVYVQSCGHVFDHKCLTPLQVNQDSCPVCRQKANNVIPILPSDFAVQSTKNKPIGDFGQAVTDITECLEQTDPAADSNYELLEKLVDTSLERMCDSLGAARLARYNVSEKSCNMLFLMSVARCNLEMELLLRGGSLVMPFPKGYSLIQKKPCILPLLRLIKARTRKLNRKAGVKLWRQLVGSSTTSYSGCPDARNQRCIVPTLLRDPIAVLLHLILILPFNFQQAHFEWIVKILYMLVSFQAAVRLRRHLTKEEQNNFLLASDEKSSDDVEMWCYDAVMRKTVQTLGHVIESETNPQEVQPKFAELCLPFLRVASILQSQLFEDQLPQVVYPTEEHQSLLAYLKLTNEIPRTESAFITTWLTEFETFVTSNSRSLTTAQTLLSGSTRVPWCQPKLIQLPFEYKDLFQAYEQKPCSVCQQTNEHISLCLVCGTLVCLQGKCCERDGVYEAVSHADSCGAGTGIYLTVSSSNVIILCGPKVGLWGSLYMDAYGEEDPDLGRGKPLYLCVERYRVLEHEWLSHDFKRLMDSGILHENLL